MYFCWTGEHFKTYDTVEEAKRAALRIIDHYRGTIPWSTLPSEVCWGEITELSAMVSKKETPEGRFDCVYEYGLKPA